METFACHSQHEPFTAGERREALDPTCTQPRCTPPVTACPWEIHHSRQRQLGEDFYCPCLARPAFSRDFATRLIAASKPRETRERLSEKAEHPRVDESKRRPSKAAGGKTYNWWLEF